MQTPRLALALTVAVIVICARIVAGGQTWNNVAYHTEVAPPRLAAAQQVQTRELPTWWDGVGLGVPLLAEPTHGAAYPLAWLAATPRALDWLVVAHLLWLALGIAIWARRRGASEFAAVGAGIFAVTAGAVIGCGLRGALFGLAHVPWIAWSAEALRARGDPRDAGDPRDGDGARDPGEARRAAVVLAVSLGLVALAGQLALVIDAVILAAVLGVSRASVRAGSRGRARVELPRLSLAIVAGLAIGAFQWGPAIASGLVHVRGGGMPIARLVELVVPGSFGAPGPAHGLVGLAGKHPWLPSLYVGAGVLALAAIGITRRIAIAAAAILVLAILRIGPTELQVAVLAVLAAASAADGLDALFAGDRRALRLVAGAVVITILALVAIAELGSRRDLDGLAASLAHGAIGVVALAAAAVIAWRARKAAWRTPVVLALVVAPGVGALGVVAPTVERSIVEDTPAWATAIGPRHAPTRVYRPTFMPDLPPELADAIATLGGGARWGLSIAPTTDPARPPLTDRTWLAAGHDGGALLERYGIAYLIVPAQMVAGLATLATHGAYALVDRTARSAPPAAVALDWTFSTNVDETLRTLFPSQRKAIPSAIVLAGTGTASQESAGALVPCTISDWHAGAIELACTAPEAAYAVVSSSSLPGWSVTVDDRATPWLTADLIRRAVAIPAGAHRIAWRYSPPGLLLGLVLALLGIAGLIALSLAGGAGDRAADPAPVRDN